LKNKAKAERNYINNLNTALLKRVGFLWGETQANGKVAGCVYDRLITSFIKNEKQKGRTNCEEFE